MHVKQNLTLPSNYILATTHRRENWGRPIENICLALKEISEKAADMHIIFSVHKNPVVRQTVHNILGNISRIKLVDPLDYLEFVSLMNNSTLILSDSGGVQEEAPALGKPLLVLRNETERPEGIAAGSNKLVGTDIKKIVSETLGIINGKSLLANETKPQMLYGNGDSSKAIASIIKKEVQNKSLNQNSAQTLKVPRSQAKLCKTQKSEKM